MQLMSHRRDADRVELMTDAQPIREWQSDLSVNTLTFLGSLLLGVIAGIAAGAAIIFAWFSNTRDEGVAAFLIGFIAFGMFVNLVAFAAVTTRHHVPSRYTALFTCAPWLGLALALTWQTCKASFITWGNWRWILASGDQRIYEPRWIIQDGPRFHWPWGQGFLSTGRLSSPRKGLGSVMPDNAFSAPLLFQYNTASPCGLVFHLRCTQSHWSGYRRT